MLEDILVVTGTIIALISYVPYFIDIYKSKTKPNATAWFIFGILGAIAFAAQIVDGAGLAALITALASFADFAIASLAIKRKIWSVGRIDVVCGIGATLSLLAWIHTSDPLYAIILVVVTYIIGYLPIYYKTYSRPYEETLITYVLSFCKFSISLIALQKYSIVTMLLPIAIVCMDLMFITMTLWRRKQIAKLVYQS
jgi:hypothetical protein